MENGIQGGHEIIRQEGGSLSSTEMCTLMWSFDQSPPQGLGQDDAVVSHESPSFLGGSVA